ncbi:PLP-dependent aminotransferase family protein [Umboniibacter marinipuniceus]|uniref:GntR family transcriptional regulator n=1 Tax=Umboniibacter marinipuniceus TaxID=569599 RepID=A0A3M0A215_9GAMM|nr:PLP-dependent aminotransferase family protein [Umboniibacter marinipuniceus]RMA78474.1 GntR family transcriptional regulator [Umboniibacter marinipuniceus]
METPLIFLDPDTELNLQSHIRQKMVEAIVGGVFPVGKRLPSSRKLAEQLGVARNTVVLVYEQLIDEGYVVSRERSGIFVNAQFLEGRVGFDGDYAAIKRESASWQRFIRRKASDKKHFEAPPNWQRFPYPFLDGQFDQSLFPAKEWREASRQALTIGQIKQWASESGGADDPMLVDEIRTKILPRRGIHANADEIMITIGVQQALYLLSDLLVDSTTSVAVEEPGYPGFRRVVEHAGGRVIPVEVDAEGMQVTPAAKRADVVITTPSHQIPMAVTMSMPRRHELLESANTNDQVVVEVDFELESNYLGQPHPSLRGLSEQDRVIYVSGLSKLLAPGLRLGFIVAPKEVIKPLRRLSALMVKHPPLSNQRTAAFFLSLGYYDTFITQIHREFERRWIALRRAVNYYLLPYVDVAPAQGGTALWLEVAEDVDVNYLAQAASARGILIEPIGDYFSSSNHGVNYFRLGITSIPEGSIKDGVDQLRDVIESLSAQRVETLSEAKGNHLRAKDISQTLEGKTMLCPIAYGDPCSIDVGQGGALLGRAGYANEDCDSGHWWVEGDLWCRRWSRWAWGDVGRYHVVTSGSVFKLFDEQGRLIDQGVLVDTHELSETTEDERLQATNWTKTKSLSGSNA